MRELLLVLVLAFVIGGGPLYIYRAIERALEEK